MQYKKNNKKSKANFTQRKALLLAAILISIFGLGFGLFALNKTDNDNETSSALEQRNVNLEPATPADRKRAEDNKTSIVDQNKNNDPAAVDNKPVAVETPDSSSKTVKPTIVDAGQYDSNIEVRAFVGGIVESNGKCITAFTINDTSFTRESTTTADATITNCSRLILPRSDFTSPGKYSVTVEYLSPTSSGISETKIIEIK